MRITSASLPRLTYWSGDTPAKHNPHTKSKSLNRKKHAEVRLSVAGDSFPHLVAYTDVIGVKFKPIQYRVTTTDSEEIQKCEIYPVWKWSDLLGMPDKTCGNIIVATIVRSLAHQSDNSRFTRQVMQARSRYLRRQEASKGLVVANSLEDISERENLSDWQQSG